MFQLFTLRLFLDRITWCLGGELAEVTFFVQWKSCTMLMLFAFYCMAELIKTTMVYTTFRARFVFRRKTGSLLQEYLIHTWSTIFRAKRIFYLILRTQEDRVDFFSTLTGHGNRCYCGGFELFCLQCNIDFVFLREIGPGGAPIQKGSGSGKFEFKRKLQGEQSRRNRA